MYRLIRLLFLGRWKLPKEHTHKWVKIATEDVKLNGVRQGTNYHLQCSECGAIEFKSSV